MASNASSNAPGRESALRLLWPLPTIVASVALGLLIGSKVDAGQWPASLLLLTLLFVLIVPIVVFLIAGDRSIARRRAAGELPDATGRTTLEGIGALFMGGASIAAVALALAGVALGLFALVAIAKGVWWLLSGMWNLI